MDDIGGIWRTVGGRRIFIKTGQDLATAMKESGKFKFNRKIGLFNEDIIGKRFKKYNNKKENLVLYDLNGKVIHEVNSDNDHSVGDFKTIYKLFFSRKNSIIAVHNHPNNSSFSLQDLKTFNRFKSLNSIVVVTKDYYYCMSKNNAKRLNTKKLVNVYDKLYNKVKNGRRKIDTIDIVNGMIAKKIGWEYEKIDRNK